MTNISNSTSQSVTSDMSYQITNREDKGGNIAKKNEQISNPSEPLAQNDSGGNDQLIDVRG
jgi:hypothetical protein